MSLARKWKKPFYVPGLDNRWWMDAWKRVLLRQVPVFPQMIQIQTRTGCNGACVFCPYPDAVNKVPRGQMSDTLFENIVDEIAHHHATRRISPYLMNEPFLDTGILQKARLIKQRVPNARIVITTNGSLLTEETVRDLVSDNPLRAIYISMQGVEKEPYEATMRGALVFEKTMENVERLVEMRNRHAPHLNIVVTMVKTNRIDADKAVAYWKSRGVQAKYTLLENRGGNTQTFDALNSGNKRVFKDCVRLLKNAYILFNGDMVLCCTDYYKTTVLGNVAKSSVKEVWNSDCAKEIRKAFLRADLSRIPLCDACYITEETP